MAWKIIDKRTGKAYVNKNGEILDNLTDEEKSIFEEAATASFGNLSNFVIEPAGEGRKTSLKQRREYFKNTSPVLAEVFPNLAEQYMKGNDSYNLGTLRAGLSDVFSLPGRAISGVAGMIRENPDGNLVEGFNLGQREGLNLGQRSGDEGGTIPGDIVRDPVTGATLLMGGPLASGVKSGMKLGGLLNLGKVGRVLGATGAGAIEGVGLEGLSTQLNDRPFTAKGAVIGATLGGATEGVGQAIRILSDRFSENLVNASIAALMKGNVKAHVTKAEREAFLADPKNMDALRRLLEDQSSGRNVFPLLGGRDRGKKFQESVDNAFNESKMTLKDEPALMDGETPLELYQNKTVFKPGERTVEDLNYPHEIPESRNFRSKNGLTKDYKYQSKAEYDLEKFADKYSEASRSISDLDINNNPMTAEEAGLLEYMKAELAKDGKVLAGYTPEYAIESNKFLGDRMPFSSEGLNGRIDALIKGQNRSVSREFRDEVRKVSSDAVNEVGHNVAKSMNERFEPGLWNELERAFAYADPQKSAPIAVRKGTRDALDRFADTLDSQAVNGVGRWLRNKDGDLYFAGKEKLKKYNYQYLAKLQETLANVSHNRHLNPEDIAGLYSEATRQNDTAVKDAIITLLEDLGVSQKAVAEFASKAGNYTMFWKARDALKHPVKGTASKREFVDFFIPQEGFNAANAIGYRLSGGFDNAVLGKNKFTPLGNISRQAALDAEEEARMYNLGYTPK